MGRIGQRKMLLALVVGIVLAGVLALPAVPQPSLVAQEEETQQAALVAVPHRAEQNSTITLALGGFLPEERISIWQTYPDIQTVVPIGDIDAGSQGNASLEITVDSSLPTGRHHFSARGNSSGRLAITAFDLLAIDLPPEEEQATVVAQVMETTLTITGSGFVDREIVAIWVNLPDESVMELGRTRATTDGEFSYSTGIDQRFVPGPYTAVAYGTVSERMGIATFEFIAPPRFDEDEGDDDNGDNGDNGSDEGDDDDDDDDDDDE
jgi:hypothetical protein